MAAQIPNFVVPAGALQAARLANALQGVAGLGVQNPPAAAALVAAAGPVLAPAVPAQGAVNPIQPAQNAGAGAGAANPQPAVAQPQVPAVVAGNQPGLAPLASLNTPQFPTDDQWVNRHVRHYVPLPCKHRETALLPCEQASCRQCARKWMDSCGYDATLFLNCSAGGRRECGRCQLLALAVARGDLSGGLTHIWAAGNEKIWEMEARVIALREIEFTKRTTQTVRAVRATTDGKLRQMGCPANLATSLASKSVLEAMPLSENEKTLMHAVAEPEYQETLFLQDRYYNGFPDPSPWPLVRLVLLLNVFLMSACVYVWMWGARAATSPVAYTFACLWFILRFCVGMPPETWLWIQWADHVLPYFAGKRRSLPSK